MYTKIELEAMNAADEAFAEVRKVAEAFAKQTGMHYHRNVTCWTSGSYFTPCDSSDKRWSEVHDLYDGDNNEAIECAWEIEREWNAAISDLRKRYDDHLWGLVLSETCNERDYYDRRSDEDLDEHERLRDRMGKIVEKWYDSACEWAYEAYIEEHAA